MKFCVLDIETNGLNPNYHEITELSVLNCQDLTQMGWDIRIKYPERSSKEAMFVTGQDPAILVKKGRPLVECIDEIDNFIKSISNDPDEIVCIGHKVSFDRNWLETKWKELGRKWLANYWVDTLEMSKKFAKNILNLGKISFGLSNMLKVAGIKETPGAHQSIIDTQNTYKLYLHMIQRGLKNTEFIKLSPTLMENLSIKKTAKSSKKKSNISDADIQDVMASLDDT